MAYTCPDCLWTSHHPMDEQQDFCGHCHRWRPNLRPNLFQQAAIKALRGPMPGVQLLALVQAHGAARSLSEIFDDLVPLFTAEKVTGKQRETLQLMFSALRIAQEGRAQLADFHVSDMPADPVE